MSTIFPWIISSAMVVSILIIVMIVDQITKEK